MKVIGPSAGQTSAAQTLTVEPIHGMAEEEFAALTQSVMIAIPHRPSEGLNANLAQCIGFWSRYGTPVATIEDQFGGFIELTRAGIVKAFLDYCRDRPNVDKLVMIDSDENVPWDAPYKLAAWDKPVVSGVVCTTNPRRGVFACFTVKDQYGVARFPSVNFSKSLPARGLLEVNSVGTGLVCIKRVVFETIRESGETPFIIPEEVRRQSIESGTLKWGEDISFCRQCEKHGFGRFVDLSVHAEHYKTLAIRWPKNAIDFESDAADWRVDSRDYVHG